MLRSGHGGADPVRGPKRLLPYAASSGRRVLAFFSPSSLLLVPAAAKAGCCAALSTGTGTAFSLPPSVFVFLSFWHHFRVLGNTDHRISIGHIIASETEEDVFRILGALRRCIYFYL